MNLKISNNAVARLAAPITAGQTSFSLQAGQGSKFPTLGEGDYFTLTAVRPDTSLEIMYVTARTFDVLTVLRGQENTLALAFDALTIVENRITAKSIMDEIHLNRSIVNAALQAFQPSVPVGLDQLRLLLLGALGVEQLTNELGTRIALIDGTSALGGSVNQRVKNATDAFIAGLTQEAADRTTYIQQYGYSKQGTNAAISAQASVTRAEFTAYADAARQSAINTATAYVQSYTYTAADIRNAISASEQTLRTEFSGGGNGGPSYATQAYVQNYAYSIAQADGAIAAQTADLRTTVGNNTAAINQSATTLNGLSAQVYTKIDVNGYVTGYGLASTGATSAFIVRAERFLFVGPDGNPQPLFSIKYVGGVAVAVLRGTLALGGSPDNIVPDPLYSDLVWWNRVGFQVDQVSLSSGFWKSGSVLRITPATGAQQDTYTSYFPMMPGATYFVEYQVFLSDDFAGTVTPCWHVPGDQFHQMGNPGRGYNWADDGLPVAIDTGTVKGGSTFNTSYTVPINGYTTQGQIRLKTRCSAGLIQIGAISITRVSDSTLIGEGSVGTRQLIIYKGGAISSGQTGFDLGNGFWLEGALAGSHGARFSVGNSSGKRFLCDPDNDILGLYNADLGNSKFGELSVYFTGTAGGSFINGTAGYGTITAHLIGGVPPYSHRWVLSKIFSSSNNAYMNADATDQASIGLSGTGTNASLSYRLTYFGSDANNRTVTMETEVDANHGTPP